MNKRRCSDGIGPCREQNLFASPEIFSGGTTNFMIAGRRRAVVRKLLQIRVALLVDSWPKRENEGSVYTVAVG